MSGTVANWVVSGLFLVFGWWIATLQASLKELRCEDRDLAEKVQHIELLVAGKYVQKDEFDRLSAALFAKLDKIDDKRNDSNSLIKALFSKLDKIESIVK
jgi:hypothetical protein